ncbi:MAG: glycosyltransferase family 2 protein [Opitutaceae bacterium]
MPVCNGMPHLPAALDSIFRQTYRRQRLIVWDNGSDDGSIEELRRWIPHRISGEIQHGKRLNAGECNARLVELATTEICARLEADGVNHHDRLLRQTAFLAAHPQVVAAGASVRAIDEEGRPHFWHGWKLDYYEDDQDIVHDLLVHAALPQPAMIFRRSAVMAAGNFHSLKRGEDYELQLRLAARGRLANVPGQLLGHRFHASSAERPHAGREHFHPEAAAMFAREGQTLFGVREDHLLRLKRCEHRRALPHLFAIVRALERREPIGHLRRLFSPSFLKSAGQLVSDQDRSARAFLGLARRVSGMRGALLL